jgi:hypothetical protein
MHLHDIGGAVVTRKNDNSIISRVRFLAALLLAAIPLFAQVGGRIAGSVVDATGASVPQATVKVFLAGGKDPVLTGTTNTDGLFAFVAVRPETYELSVEAKGFATVRMKDVGVSPLQETTLPPIKMAVATAVSVVDVSAQVQTVKRSSAEISSTITNAQIQNLPVLGRQVTTLYQTQPGVNVGTDVTSVNGTRPSFTNVTMDGVNIQDNFVRTNDLDYPPLRTTIDQIGEITVTTSNATAAIGGGTSQVILTTRSGSNTYHASVYWYNRNSALSANDWFNNKTVDPVTGKSAPKTFLDLNQVGASVSGRIIRDKLFFFANPEFYRNKAQSVRTRTVLTDSAKNGVFTYKDASTGVLRTINVLTAKNAQIDPTSKAMLASLPEPNTTDLGDGLNTSGYRFNARDNENRDQLVLRGDYYLTPNQNFTATYNSIDNPTDRPDQGTFYTIAPPVSNTIKDYLLSLAYIWTIRPTLTNEVRVGYLRTNSSFLDSNTYPKVLAAGLLFSNPVNTFLNQGRKVNNYHYQDNANWLRGRHQIAFGFQAEHQYLAPFNDAGIIPTLTLGISSANMTGFVASDLPGGTSANVNTANNLYANLAGIVSQAAQTFNVNSPTSEFAPGATNLRQFTLDTYAGYVQDTWRVRSNWTLNLGLRYEIWTPLDEANSLALEPTLTGDAKTTVLNSNATLNFAGKSVGRPLYKTDRDNYAPNIGVAFDPTGKGTTSVRAGYSIGYAFDNVVTAVRNSVGTANGLTFANTQTNLAGNLTAGVTVAPPPYKVPRTLADNYAISTTAAVGLTDPNLETPKLQQWNFSIEHEYKGAIFAARYVGNRGSQLLRAIDYNQININASGFLADFQRAQSNAVLSQAANGSYNGNYNAAIAGSQPLTVFPLLAVGGSLTSAANQTLLKNGEVGTLADNYMTARQNGPVNFYANPNVQGANVVTNGGISNYNGLQLDVTKRTRSGLQVQFNYAYGQALSNTSGDLQTDFEPLLDNASPQLEYARAPFDIRQSFKSNYYYELPYGRNNRGHGLLNEVLGGWAVSGIWQYSTGEPYSILSGLGTLNRGARSTTTNTASVLSSAAGASLSNLTGRVYMTGNGPYFLSPSLINPLDGRGASAPGTAPFPGQILFNPTAGTVGNLQRRMFSGPAQWSWDTSVKKQFHITERQTVDFHFDFFNWLNHPTFYLPPSYGDYGSQTNVTINNTTFGKLSSMNFAPRQIQFGLYYSF